MSEKTLQAGTTSCDVIGLQTSSPKYPRTSEGGGLRSHGPEDITLLPHSPSISPPHCMASLRGQEAAGHPKVAHSLRQRAALSAHLLPRSREFNFE